MDNIDLWMTDLIHTLNTCSDEQRKQLIDSIQQIHKDTEDNSKDDQIS